MLKPESAGIPWKLGGGKGNKDRQPNQPPLALQVVRGKPLSIRAVSIVQEEGLMVLAEWLPLSWVLGLERLGRTVPSLEIEAEICYVECFQASGRKRPHSIRGTPPPSPQ